MKNFILFLLISSPIIQLSSQSICEFNEMELFFKAYTLNSVALWEKAIESLQSRPNAENDKEIQLQLAYANYGLAGNCIGSGKKERGIQATVDGETAALSLLDDEKYGSEAHALLSGVYGLQIAFNPMKGMILGAKSDRYCEKAIKLDDENAFAYLQKGSSLYNTPKMFGGDVEKSIDEFQKAINLYEKQDFPLNPWKLEAMAWLGQAYANVGQYKNAKMVYDKVLAEAPDFGWVKSYLLPKVEAKL